jgi:hypothetical protein
MVGTISMDKVLAVGISALQTAQEVMEAVGVMEAEVIAVEITMTGTLSVRPVFETPLSRNKAKAIIRTLFRLCGKRWIGRKI